MGIHTCVCFLLFVCLFVCFFPLFFVCFYCWKFCIHCLSTHQPVNLLVFCRSACLLACLPCLDHARPPARPPVHLHDWPPFNQPAPPNRMPARLPDWPSACICLSRCPVHLFNSLSILFPDCQAVCLFVCIFVVVCFSLFLWWRDWSWGYCVSVVFNEEIINMLKMLMHLSAKNNSC